MTCDARNTICPLKNSTSWRATDSKEVTESLLVGCDWCRLKDTMSGYDMQSHPSQISVVTQVGAQDSSRSAITMTSIHTKTDAMNHQFLSSTHPDIVVSNFTR